MSLSQLMPFAPLPLQSMAITQFEISTLPALFIPPADVSSFVTVPFTKPVSLPPLKVAVPSQLMIFEPLPLTVASMIPPLCVKLRVVCIAELFSPVVVSLM